MITFDTYAWVEFFDGTKKGEVVKHYVESDEIIFTPTICLAEYKARLMRDGKAEKAISKALGTIMKRSMLVQLDTDIALKAGELKNGGLYMMDAIVYATALRHETELLTGDQHFKEYENVVLLN